MYERWQLVGLLVKITTLSHRRQDLIAFDDAHPDLEEPAGFEDQSE